MGMSQKELYLDYLRAKAKHVCYHFLSRANVNGWANMYENLSLGGKRTEEVYLNMYRNLYGHNAHETIPEGISYDEIIKACTIEGVVWLGDTAVTRSVQQIDANELPTYKIPKTPAEYIPFENRILY